MSIFSDNIRLLRGRAGLTQQAMAEKLIISRSRLAKYEDGRSEPPHDVLYRMAKHFQVSIDLLISYKLSGKVLDNLRDLADNRILLPVNTGGDGKGNIEIVPVKAKAGYLAGYADPEFVERFQVMSMPQLGNGIYRAFPIDGDSMPPHGPGSFIVGRYVERLRDLRDGKTYIILSRDEGIVYKRVYRKNKKDDVLLLHSDNNLYEPYEIKTSDVLELWEFASSFSHQAGQPEDLSYTTIRGMVEELRREIRNIKS